MASVVTELCRRAGLADVDTSELYGFVRDFSIADVNDVRNALHRLTMRYGFDAIERDEPLRFAMRKPAVPMTSDADRLAMSDEVDGTIERCREAEAELSGRVLLRFVESEGDPCGARGRSGFAG